MNGYINLYIHTMAYSALRRNNYQVMKKTWKKLRCILLSKRSHSKTMETGKGSVVARTGEDGRMKRQNIEDFLKQ